MAAHSYPAFMGVPPVYLASALASQKLFSSLSFAESFSSVHEVRAKKFRMMPQARFRSERARDR